MVYHWPRNILQYNMQRRQACKSEVSSAKCTLVWKPHANLPDTLVDPPCAPKYFQILPGPSAGKHSALRFCNTFLRCYRKHLQWWRCIQDAIRFDLYNSPILKQLSPLHRSAEDFKTSWDLCIALQDTWCHIHTTKDIRVPQPQSILSIIFVVVTVTKYATSSYGLQFQSISGYVHTINLASNSTWVKSVKHQDMEIERTWRCTSIPLRRDNRFLTTTTIHFGWGRSHAGLQRSSDLGDRLSAHGGHTMIQGYCWWTEQWGVYPLETTG